MSIINGLLRAIFDGLLSPFSGLAPIWGLLPVSLVVSIGMLLIFRATSNQDALDQVKRGIHAGLFEIRLWNDDIRAILRAQFDILRKNLSYLRYSLPPMLWIIPPLFLIVAQLQFHYGYQGLEPGDTTLLEVELVEDAVDTEGAKPVVTLDLPQGLVAETPAVWSPSTRELTWRIAAQEEGSYDIGLTIDGASFSKTAVVGTNVRRLSPQKVRGWLSELIYPAEAPLGDGAVEKISLSYQDREVDMLGWSTHWIIHFFILTIVFAFLLRKPLGVTI